MRRPATLLALIAFALALPGCKRTNPPGEPSETLAARETAADTLIVASVQVRGHDGQPLAATHVEVQRNLFRAPLFAADLEGERVEIELPGRGAYRFVIAGVDHAELELDLSIERSFTLDVRLGTHDFHRSPRDQAIQVRWVDAQGHAGVVQEFVGAPRDGQRYAYALLAPLGTRAIRYQLVDRLTDHTINGPGGTAWVYDGDGDFWSERAWSNGGPLEIDFGLLPPPTPAQVELVPRVIASRRQEAWLLLDSHQTAASMLLTMPLMPGEFESTMRELADAALATIAAIEDAELRSAATLEWAWFFGQGGPELVSAASLREVLDGVSPGDPAWVFVAGSLDEVFASRSSDPWLREYRARIAAQQHDPGLLAALRYLDIIELDARGELDARDDQLAVLMREFEGSEPAFRARTRFDTPLVPGRTMPAWTFAGLVGERVASSDFAGRAYLLHVWASYCGPCVDEMPLLHEIWTALGGEASPVAFVSVGIDDDVGVIADFREQWPMPWMHVFVPPDEQPALHDAWAFESIPLLVHVDAQGVIVEVELGFHSDGLLARLAGG